MLGVGFEIQQRSRDRCTRAKSQENECQPRAVCEQKPP